MKTKQKEEETEKKTPTKKKKVQDRAHISALCHKETAGLPQNLEITAVSDMPRLLMGENYTLGELINSSWSNKL